MTHNPVFCAVDMHDIGKAFVLATSLQGHVHGIKLGLEFFLAHGADGYRRIGEVGLPIFLDLKLHDIPNTVAGAVRSLLPLRPAFMTIHTGGGGAMMRAAVDAAGTGQDRPKLLGVTVLTSMDGGDLVAVGQGADSSAQVLRLAKLAKDSGLDGVICSPQEVKSLRVALGADFILMVPGVRPSWADANDQKRVMTPRDAMQAGASYLVIGRPITGARDPTQAAQKIWDEIKG
jgi:orotidine-5'-phosphate decarboxylase